VAVALLTPVPVQHLVSGTRVAETEGCVAFGSQAWEVFRELDRAGGPGTRVLIYPSHSDGPPSFSVHWIASYVRYVESRGGAHPKGSRLRPPTAVEGGEDDERYWAGFYEVEGLTALPPEHWLPIADLRRLDGRRYERGFAPEGPIIISAP
jgi:hypothetical protein